jgi:FKBP-type peptidyl-prolyl cis-trans isomerase
LYGDKPICIEGYRKRPIDLHTNEWQVIKINAFDLLKKWRIISKDNKYLFLFCDYLDCSHMIVINRNAFIKTVTDNLSLFRYLLGRTITAESLLNELATNENQFYEIIKHNKTIIGILLGYGTNNSLIVSRLEELTDPIPNINAFPFFCSSLQEKPFLGFHTLEGEKNKLTSMTVGSNSMLDVNTYPIPCFGCEPASEETIQLLSVYKKNRATILQAVDDKNFLAKTLEKIFTKVSGEIVFPSIEPVKLFDLKNHSLAAVADAVYEETKIENLGQVPLLKAFMLGVADRNEESSVQRFTDSDASVYLCESGTIDKRLECCRNLFKANALFDKITKKKQWSSLIPHGISYKSLRTGKGESATSHIREATFHYSYRLVCENKSTIFGTIDKAAVNQLIPGIAHALIGMKRGEERLLLIHPRYAYGVYMDPSNAALVVKIQLLDFKEGDCETTILPTCSLEPSYCHMALEDTERTPLPKMDLDATNSQRDLLATYKCLLEKQKKIAEWNFYNFGVNFWDSIKQSGLSLDLERFCLEVNSRVKAKSTTTTAKEKEQFIREFKSHLFTLQYEKGVKPPFASWF